MAFRRVWNSWETDGSVCNFSIVGYLRFLVLE